MENAGIITDVIKPFHSRPRSMSLTAILRQLSEFGADVGSQAAGNSFSGCRLGRKPHGGTAAHDSFGGSAAVSRGKTTYGVISNTEPAAVRPEVVP
jgi:hypothetical protein